MTKGDNAIKETGYGTIETRKWTLETGANNDIKERNGEKFWESRKEKKAQEL